MSNKFLKIKEWKGEGRQGSYYYAERLGKDSVAFVLINRNTGKVGLIREFKPPINEYLVTAFGGSLDKPVSHEQIIREEVAEEAGYTGVHLSYAGQSYVSTQMNQWCHLYLVDVTHCKQGKANPQTELEKLASIVWLYPEEIKRGDCWKAITILSKMGMI